jgi:hypothetical protein
LNPKRVRHLVRLGRRILATIDRKARLQLDRIKHTNATAATDTVRLFGQLGRLVLDDTIPDSQLRACILSLIAPEPRRTRSCRPAEGKLPLGSSQLLSQQVPAPCRKGRRLCDRVVLLSSTPGG